MPSKSIADAHREAACCLISSKWGRGLALALGASIDTHDATIKAAGERIGELSDLEKPPEDLQDHVDAFFLSVQANLLDGQKRLTTIVENPTLAALLYPVVTEVDPKRSLALVNTRLSTLAEVWKPGGNA